MVAVDTSNKLHYKANLTAPWVTQDEYLQFTPAGVLPLRDGSILALSANDRHIYRRSLDASTFDQIYGSCCCDTLGMSQDGRIVALGDGDWISAKPLADMTTGWTYTDWSSSQVSCKAMSMLASGVPMCLSRYAQEISVWTASTWQPLTDPVPLRDATAYGNMILGLSSDGNNLVLRFPAADGQVASYSGWHNVSRSPNGVQLAKIGAVPAASLVTVNPGAYGPGILWVKMFH